MAIDLDILNANQRAAVEWTGGPLLVLAGPGSGKTMVITMRVAKLIEETPNQRFKILGLTFTNNAAAEMRSRVEVMVPEARERTSLRTFHAFCANILRQHGSHLGLSPDFVILNQQADREAVLIDAIRQIRSEGADVEESDIRILPLIDRLMVHDIPEDQVEDHFQDKALGWKVARLYETYKQLLISRNQVDFPSLLNGVVNCYMTSHGSQNTSGWFTSMFAWMSFTTPILRSTEFYRRLWATAPMIFSSSRMTTRSYISGMGPALNGFGSLKKITR